MGSRGSVASRSSVGTVNWELICLMPRHLMMRWPFSCASVRRRLILMSALEELLQFLPDLDETASMLDAVDETVLAGGSTKFVFGHTGMLAELFEIGFVVPPLDLQCGFAACAVEGQRIEVLAFVAAMIGVGEESTCQPIA